MTDASPDLLLRGEVSLKAFDRSRQRLKLLLVPSPLLLLRCGLRFHLSRVLRLGFAQCSDNATQRACTRAAGPTCMLRSIRFEAS